MDLTKFKPHDTVELVVKITVPVSIVRERYLLLDAHNADSESVRVYTDGSLEGMPYVPFGDVEFVSLRKVEE